MFCDGLVRFWVMNRLNRWLVWKLVVLIGLMLVCSLLLSIFVRLLCEVMFLIVFNCGCSGVRLVFLIVLVFM